MSGPHEPWWQGYEPVLFRCFDPCQTYLTSLSPEFRDAAGRQLVDVDLSIELLLVGYAALTQIGAGKLPTQLVWRGLVDHACSLMRERAPSFKISAVVLRADPRIEAMNPFTYTTGSLHVMLLHEVILDQQQRSNSVIGQGDLLCLLSLMWLDEALRSLLAQDAFEGVEYALRAGEYLGMAKPQK